VFRKTADSFLPGARTLPRACYVSPAVFADEQERISSRLWNCAGRASSLRQPGEYLVRDIAGESILVVRGVDGPLRAFFNVCRHRGTRLCSDAAGRFEGRIQCPYHAWTYALDGRLVGAPHMHEVPGFALDDYPLHEAAVAEWGGFVFVSIASEPERLADWFAPVVNRLDRFGLAALSTVHAVEYDVHANWKLVFQNYSECLHCPIIHPGLSARIPYQSGSNDLTEGPFLGGYMELTGGTASVTRSGRLCGPFVGSGDDHRRAYYYSILPNLLLSIHPDYVNFYLVRPMAPDRTRIESEWLFAPGTNRVGDPNDAIAFWDEINRQDWGIIERGQQGISSSRYVPGPYSPRESISAAWDREYLRLMDREERQPS
jgi:Rieske 2Fe-2S family protein